MRNMVFLPDWFFRNRRPISSLGLFFFTTLLLFTSFPIFPTSIFLKSLLFFSFLTLFLFEFYGHLQLVWEKKEDSSLTWLPFGMYFLLGNFILLRLTGGLQSSLYPFLYLSLGFLCSFGTYREAMFGLSFAFFLEFSSLFLFGNGFQSNLKMGAVHFFFLSLFAASHYLLFGLKFWLEIKWSSKNNTAKELQVPDFLQPASQSNSFQEQSILLDLLKEGLDVHGCVVLWLTDDQLSYQVVRAEVETSILDPGPFPIQTGAPAGVFKGKSKFRIVRQSHSESQEGILLPYYDPKEVQIFSFLAIPIFSNQKMVGALCLDRRTPRAFLPQEEILLEAAALTFEKTLEPDHASFMQQPMQESLFSLENLTHLLKAKDLHDLGKRGLTLLREKYPFDFGLFAQCLPEQQLLITSSFQHKEWVGQQFDTSRSLLTLAFKHQRILPEQGHIRSKEPFFSEQEPQGIRKFQSLLLVPVFCQEQAMGAFVLGSQTSAVFEKEFSEKESAFVAQTVGWMTYTLQLKQKLNANPTQDEMTGLLTYTHFLHQFEKWFEQPPLNPVSLLLLDIDRLHDINGMFGYQTGNIVLQQVAQHLLKNIQTPFLAGRYGGDEIIFVLENTTQNEALKLADRWREELSFLSFFPQEHKGEVFSITVSMGCSTYPDLAQTPKDLIQTAKMALQQAKKRGENNVSLGQSIMGLQKNTPIHLEQNLLIPPRQGWGWGTISPVSYEQSIEDSFLSNWSQPVSPHESDAHTPENQEEHSQDSLSLPKLKLK